MSLKLLYTEVLRQLEIVNAEALQDMMLIHYLQHEVAKSRSFKLSR